MGRINLKSPNFSSTDPEIIKRQKMLQEQQVELFAKNMAQTFSGYSRKSLSKAAEYFEKYAKEESKKKNPSEDELKATNAGKIAAFLKQFSLANSYLQPVRDNYKAHEADSFISVYNTIALNNSEAAPNSLKDAFNAFLTEHGYSSLSDDSCALCSRLAQDCKNIEQEAELLRKQEDVLESTQKIIDLGEAEADLQKKENELMLQARELGIDGSDMEGKKDSIKKEEEKFNQQIREFEGKKEEIDKMHQEYTKKYDDAVQQYKSMVSANIDYEVKLKNDYTALGTELQEYQKNINDLKQTDLRRKELIDVLTKNEQWMENVSKAKQEIINHKADIEKIEKSEDYAQRSKEIQVYSAEKDKIESALKLDVMTRAETNQKDSFQKTLDTIRAVYKSGLFSNPPYDGKKDLEEFNAAVKQAKKDLKNDSDPKYQGLDYYGKWLAKIEETTHFKNNLSDRFIYLGKKINGIDDRYRTMLDNYSSCKRKLFDAQNVLKSNSEKLLSDKDRSAKTNELVELNGKSKDLKNVITQKSSKFCNDLGIKNVSEYVDPKSVGIVLEKKYKEDFAKMPHSEADLKKVASERDKAGKIKDGTSPYNYGIQLQDLKNKSWNAYIKYGKAEKVSGQLKECYEAHQQNADKQTDILADLNKKESIPNLKGITENLKWFTEHYTDAQKSADYKNSKQFENMVDQVQKAYLYCQGKLPKPDGSGMEPVTSSGLAEVFGKVQTSSQAYLDAKRSQTRLIPSDQRRARMRFSEDLISFSKETKKHLTEDLSMIQGAEVVEKFANNKQTITKHDQPSQYYSAVQNRVNKAVPPAKTEPAVVKSEPEKTVEFAKNGLS